MKNHFVHEIIFGSVLSALAIFLLYQPMNFQQWILVAALGPIDVLQFWIAALFGWTIGGMQLAWQGEIESRSAYILHGSQTLIFFVGIVLPYFSTPTDG